MDLVWPLISWLFGWNTAMSSYTYLPLGFDSYDVQYNYGQINRGLSRKLVAEALPTVQSV